MAKSNAQVFLNSINDKYDRIHEELYRRYAVGQRQDTKHAQELERFFNYLVYNKKDQLNLNNILTEELANQILRKNPKIGSLLRRSSTSAAQQGTRGEEGFAKLILATVQEVSEGTEILPNTKTLITGNELVTVLKDIPQNLGQRITKKVGTIMTQEQQKAVDQSQMYAEFQQKTDIQSLRATGTYSLKPGYEWLLELAATVKNYSSATVSVGNTSRMKIMRATITNSRSLSLQEKTDLLNQLNHISKLNIYTKSNKATKGFEHFQHVQAVYDLIGFGQGKYVDNIFQGAELPNFLMVNLTGDRRIVIRSTRQLVAEILRNSNVSITASGTRFKF